MHPFRFVLAHPVWLLALLLGGTLLLNAIALSPLGGRVAAQGPEPQAPQAALGTGFTYQGQLKKSNLPVTASCSMSFSLWDSQANGTGQLGISQTVNPVAVASGFFTVVLNAGSQFSTSAFSGQDRW